LARDNVLAGHVCVLGESVDKDPQDERLVAAQKNLRLFDSQMQVAYSCCMLRTMPEQLSVRPVLAAEVKFGAPAKSSRPSGDVLKVQLLTANGEYL
jgi:hypothetical protein